MIQIIVANEEHAQTLRELFQEYLEWRNTKLYEEFGVIFDTPELVESTMQHLDDFMPPKGRLLLGYVEDQPMGIACLKALTDRIGEVKRMYVRPEAQKRGLGRAILNQLLEEARQIGYERKPARSDTSEFV